MGKTYRSDSNRGVRARLLRTKDQAQKMLRSLPNGHHSIPTYKNMITKSERELKKIDDDRRRRDYERKKR